MKKKITIYFPFRTFPESEIVTEVDNTTKTGEKTEYYPLQGLVDDIDLDNVMSAEGKDTPIPVLVSISPVINDYMAEESFKEWLYESNKILTNKNLAPAAVVMLLPHFDLQVSVEDGTVLYLEKAFIIRIDNQFNGPYIDNRNGYNIRIVAYNKKKINNT